MRLVEFLRSFIGDTDNAINNQLGFHSQPDSSGLNFFLLHIPADHEHRFRFNVNTISGPM